MPDVFLSRRQLMITAIESTYAVDRNPEATNSYQPIRLIDPFTLNLGQEFVENAGGNLTSGFGRPIATVRPAGVTFRTYVQGLDSGSYTTTRKPPVGDLLRACGLFETFVTSNADGQPEYQYAPRADVGSDTSINIVAHQDGYEHRLVGNRGNVNLIFGAYAPVVAEFTFRGLLRTEAATTRVSSVVIPTGVPPVWIGSGTIFVSSLAGNVENLSFNTNYTVLEQRASLADSGSGIVQILLTDRQPGGSFDPEATQPGTHDFFGAWRNSSGSVLRARAGTTQGNRVTLISSQAVYRNVGWGDKSGLNIFNVDFQAAERNGNDEYQILFN